MRLDSFLAATEKLTYTEAAGVWTVAEKNMASTAPQPAPTKLHHTVGSRQAPRYRSAGRRSPQKRRRGVPLRPHARDSAWCATQHYFEELSRKPQAVRQVAPELLAELGPAYRKLWRIWSCGRRPTARLFAKLLSVVTDHGSEEVAAALEEARPPAASTCWGSSSGVLPP